MYRRFRHVILAQTLRTTHLAKRDTITALCYREVVLATSCGIHQPEPCCSALVYFSRICTDRIAWLRFSIKDRCWDCLVSSIPASKALTQPPTESVDQPVAVRRIESVVAAIRADRNPSAAGTFRGCSHLLGCHALLRQNYLLAAAIISAAVMRRFFSFSS